MKKWIRPLSNKTKWANQEGAFWNAKSIYYINKAVPHHCGEERSLPIDNEICRRRYTAVVLPNDAQTRRVLMLLGRLKSNDAYYGDRMSDIMQKCQGKYGNWHLQVWRLGFILDLYTSLKKRNCNEGDMLGQMLVNVFLLIRELMALSIDLWNIQSHVHLYIKQVFDIYAKC